MLEPLFYGSAILSVDLLAGSPCIEVVFRLAVRCQSTFAHTSLFAHQGYLGVQGVLDRHAGLGILKKPDTLVRLFMEIIELRLFLLLLDQSDGRNSLTIAQYELVIANRQSGQLELSVVFTFLYHQVFTYDFSARYIQ